MVQFTTLAISSLAAAAGAIAGPVQRRDWDPNTCMTDADAQYVADNYGTLIEAYSDALANKALTTDFTDYSEGVNTLINTCPQGASAQTLPLLAPTFSSREQFKTGQGEQPPIHFTQLGIHHDCNSVTIRWSSDNTAPIPNPRPVVGLILLETELTNQGWKVNTAFSEFDSGAWLQNLEEWGICTVAAPASPTLQISGSPSGVPQTNSAATPLVTPVSSAAASGTAPASYSAVASGSAVVSSGAAYGTGSSAPAASSYAASSYRA